MKLRQLVYLTEVVKRDCNISAAAKALFTSQPGVSRQLQDLAAELGVELFRHQGKRLIGLTEAGAEIAAIAQDVLRDVQRLQAVAEAHASGGRSRLTIVTSRHAAKHLLADALTRCRDALLGIEVQVCEEDPARAVELLLAGGAQVGVLVEPAERNGDLWYQEVESWGLLLVVPEGHPLTLLPELTLPALACFPVCSYEPRSASRQVIERTFAASGLESPITIALGSTPLILEFVERGVAVGLVAASGFDPDVHPTLFGVRVDHLFRPLSTELVLPRRGRLPEFVYRFARLLAPGVTRNLVQFDD